MQIGELFILRINIHLNGSVLDTPELFWVEPQLEPVYQAVRSYLEMDQRVSLLTERLDVIADLLAVLKDQLSHGHGEKLEWIGMSHFFVTLSLSPSFSRPTWQPWRDANLHNSNCSHRDGDPGSGCKYRGGSIRGHRLGASSSLDIHNSACSVSRCTFCFHT